MEKNKPWAIVLIVVVCTIALCVVAWCVYTEPSILAGWDK